MIENSLGTQKHDRLAAFIKAYGLRADYRTDDEAANLLILDAQGLGTPTHLLYRPQSVDKTTTHMVILAAAHVDFGIDLNPLVGALPEQLLFDLSLEPQLRGIAELIILESIEPRCGGSTILTRLCEIVVVLAVRRALATGTVNAGLLAGLAHPELHSSLVAMHDEPARRWSVQDLADITGMKRGRYIEVFNKTVGYPPGAYLSDWRLALGRVKLRAGQTVKVVASAVGFGSAEAFSRAFSRKYGYPPRKEVQQIQS